MNLRDAAQQALEALEEYQSKGAPFWACDSAVAALRAALEQPEQEPFGYFQYAPQFDAWVQNRDDTKGVAFYTHPPRREWQGLTEEERRHIYATTEEFGHEIARAIEAALKEKNK